MNSDQQVSSKLILQALMQVKRQGTLPSIQKLEQTEPDMAAFVLENLSLLNTKLQEFGHQPQQTRRLYRQFEAFVVVCIESLRAAHYQLWKSQAQSSPLAELDSQLNDGSPTAEEIDLHPPYDADDPHPPTS